MLLCETFGIENAKWIGRRWNIIKEQKFYTFYATTGNETADNRKKHTSFCNQFNQRQIFDTDVRTQKHSFTFRFLFSCGMCVSNIYTVYGQIFPLLHNTISRLRISQHGCKLLDTLPLQAQNRQHYLMDRFFPAPSLSLYVCLPLFEKKSSITFWRKKTIKISLPPLN